MRVYVCVLLFVVLAAMPLQAAPLVTLPPTPTEIVVALPAGAAESAAFPAAAGVPAESARLLLADATHTLLVLRLAPGTDPAQAAAALAGLPGVSWAAPNRVYPGDPRELTPNDPSFTLQYAHQLMQTPAAWDVSTGEGVVIAVTDDGIPVNHPDLAANIWVNSGEIAGNTIDDDGNGYVDDINGWDVLDNDGDLTPLPGDRHGTHVAGIAAARLNNAEGVAGVAGRARLMMVRFYGTNQPWTSIMVAEALRYAADNGARIINTSYNIDGLVGDPIATAGFDYAYQKGVLLINSAGNTNTRNPLRQAFTQTLLVAATDSADRKWGNSNVGSGIDLAAPGVSVYATFPGGYGYNTGTSMAAPQAAGVAALIWAAHPDWTRDQVAAQLLGTADAIDAQNPAFVGLLGAGRLNAARAVTETLAAPRLTPLDLPPEGATITTAQTMTFTFGVPDVLDAATVITGSFELRGVGPDGLFDTNDDLVVPLHLTDGLPYRVGTNRVSVQSGVLVPDRYRLTARSGVNGLRDPFGTALDGNGDRVPGDAFVRTFSVQYQVYGLVYHDWNRNGLRETSESALPGIPVWIDLNRDGLLNNGEAQAQTSSDGWYVFNGLPVGSYQVRAVPPPGWVPGAPAEIVIAPLSGSRADLGLFRPYERQWLLLVQRPG